MFKLKYAQRLPLSLEESWDFFSSPKNLKILTPGHLGFEIQKDFEDKKMYAGQIIAYTIRPVFNIPLEWVTEITQVNEPYFFIDEQRFGPYKFWHHEHRFNSIVGGVEIVDTIYYKMPFGLIGRFLHFAKVKGDLEAIFSFRHQKLEELFGLYSGNVIDPTDFVI